MAIDTVHEVEARLAALEKRYGIRILYAVEAGSRSWGYPSPDSDYDVRFIYAYDYRRYLELTPPADVIENHDDELWDIVGWDIRKSLTLLKKGNPSIAQWLYAPIVYRQNREFVQAMRDLLHITNPRTRLYWAYRSTAHSLVQEYILGKDEVNYKKLLFTVQSTLAMRWVETRDAIAPSLFSELVSELVTDESLLAEIDGLVRIKSESDNVEGSRTFFASSKTASAKRSRPLRRTSSFRTRPSTASCCACSTFPPENRRRIRKKGAVPAGRPSSFFGCRISKKPDIRRAFSPENPLKIT